MNKEEVNTEKKTGSGSNPNSRKNLKPWKKGQKVPGAGHPKGQRNFITIYKAALKIVAQKANITPNQLEDEIIAQGILKARTGNYPFFKDILDRLHGQAAKKLDMTSNGKRIDGFVYVNPEAVED